ncbi:hypothetical protein Tco_1363307 [Tanacetum coccineum]
MASAGSDRDAEYALSKLLQMGTVAEYQNEFEMLINRVTGISKSLLKSFYISGLKVALRIKLSRARPTTLGEAISLTRITEARFEDERSAIAIAKLNDLNIRVQVQDLEERLAISRTNWKLSKQVDDSKEKEVRKVQPVSRNKAKKKASSSSVLLKPSAADHATFVNKEEMMSRQELLLLLALPNEHRLRFSKYDNAKELWEAILKTFGGNEVTKKTKKNQLKQQYSNFKAEGSETLEQTFNTLQAIVSHLEFMDVPIEKDDLNQKF